MVFCEFSKVMCVQDSEATCLHMGCSSWEGSHGAGLDSTALEEGGQGEHHRFPSRRWKDHRAGAPRSRWLAVCPGENKTPQLSKVSSWANKGQKWAGLQVGQTLLPGARCCPMNLPSVCRAQSWGRGLWKAWIRSLTLNELNLNFELFM